jgi:hypothetical protein
MRKLLLSFVALLLLVLRLPQIYACPFPGLEAEVALIGIIQ